jgi:YD repeat-containing protein
MDPSSRDYAFRKPEKFHLPDQVLPSAEGYEYLLDSTFAFQWNADRNNWESLERVIIAYDSLGQIKERLYQRWDRVMNGFADVEKTVWTYGPGNFLQEVLYLYKEYAYGEWLRSYRQVYYDLGFGRIIEEDGQYWDTGSQNWLNDYRLTRTFDLEGYLIELVSQTWNPDFRIWSNYSKSSWTYKESALLHQLLYQRWNDGHWNDIDRYVYQYNDQRDPTLLLYQWWTGTWSDRERYTYAYDEQGNLIEYRYQDWNRLTEKWLDQYLETYTYDALGNPSSRVSRFIPAGSSNWVNYRNDSYLSDERGFTTEETTEYWDERWIKTAKYLREYNAYGHLTDSTSQFWDDFLETWVNNFRMQWYYSEHRIATAAAEFAVNPAVSVFPNPVQEMATFSYPAGQEVRIDLYNAAGILLETIRDGDGNGRSQVRLNQLQPGIYLYRLSGSHGILHSGKVVIRN